MAYSEQTKEMFLISGSFTLGRENKESSAEKM